MKRRTFITALLSTAVAPIAVKAQPVLSVIAPKKIPFQPNELSFHTILDLNPWNVCIDPPRKQMFASHLAQVVVK